MTTNGTQVFEVDESHYLYAPNTSVAPGGSGGWTGGAVFPSDVTGPAPGAVVVDATNMYVAFGPSILVEGLSGTGEGTVFYAPKGAAATITDVVLDATNVWV